MEGAGMGAGGRSTWDGNDADVVLIYQYINSKIK